MGALKVYQIKVPELWYQTYYVRASNPEQAFADFRSGLSEHKVGETEFEESLEHYDGWAWEVEEVRGDKELMKIRAIPLAHEAPRG